MDKIIIRLKKSFPGTKCITKICSFCHSVTHNLNNEKKKLKLFYQILVEKKKETNLKKKYNHCLFSPWSTFLFESRGILFSERNLAQEKENTWNMTFHYFLKHTDHKQENISWQYTIRKKMNSKWTVDQEKGGLHFVWQTNPVYVLFFHQFYTFHSLSNQ